MKISRLSCVCIFSLTSLLAFADDNRTWTDAASGRKLEGSIESKSNDGSEVKVKRKDNGKSVTLKTTSLVGEDQTFIKGWTLPAKGIVLEHQSILQQSKGGFGNIIDEMGILFAPFDEAKDDQAAHPEAVIYEGTPADTSLGGYCKITYLMPLAEVEAKLLKNRGAVLKLKVVGPAFPPGLKLYNYDINIDGYNHLGIVTDAADQVVTLQFISGNASRGFPNLYFKLDPGPELLESIVHGSKCNYVDLKDGAGGIARSRKGETIPVVAQLGGGSQSVTWFVPKPLVRQILFHVAEKKKTRK